MTNQRENIASLGVGVVKLWERVLKAQKQSTTIRAVLNIGTKTIWIHLQTASTRSVKLGNFVQNLLSRCMRFWSHSIADLFSG